MDVAAVRMFEHKNGSRVNVTQAVPEWRAEGIRDDHILEDHRS